MLLCYAAMMCYAIFLRDCEVEDGAAAVELAKRGLRAREEEADEEEEQQQEEEEEGEVRAG